MAEWRRRVRTMTQTEVARASGASVQAVCDVVKGRRPPNAKLLKWLGFEVGYVPIVRRPRATVTDSSDTHRVGVETTPAADAAAPAQSAPPGAGV